MFCAYCGTHFTPANKRRKFCSTACASDARRTRPKNDPRPCIVCGKLWRPTRGNGTARFCSIRCQMLGTNGENRLNTPGAKRKANDAKRGRRKGGLSYTKRDGRHEHRLVAEQKLGRQLLAGEIVHHIDGNRLNNDPVNLEVMTQSEHARAHNIERWRKARAAKS